MLIKNISLLLSRFLKLAFIFPIKVQFFQSSMYTYVKYFNYIQLNVSLKTLKKFNVNFTNILVVILNLNCIQILGYKKVAFILMKHVSNLQN